MAGPKKKSRKASGSDSDSGSQSNQSESGSYNGQQEIQATFEGRNPEGQDFHGIKQLLQQLFLKAHIDLSQMSDMLINQMGVGSVLKQGYSDSENEEDDDEDDLEMSDQSNVFGITSVINLSSHKETPCIQQFILLLEQLMKEHTDQKTQQEIGQIINDKKVGFLINERFINIPAQISVPLLNSLNEEIERIKKKNNSFNFDYYIMICKTSRPKENSASEEIFSNDEEEIFSKCSDVSFDFNVVNEADVGLGGNWLSEDKQVLPYRRVLIFKAVKLKNIISEISTLVG